jgi:serine protease Do
MRKYVRSLKAQYAMAVLAGALLIGGGAALFEQDVHAKEKSNKPVPAHVTVDNAPVQRERQMVTSFSTVVKKVSPSVVKVYSTFKGQEMGMQGGGNQVPEDLLRRFFGDQFGDNGDQPSRGSRNGRMRRNPAPKQLGVGSGVIISKDGYILTNNHVVDNAEEVKVQIGDRGEEITAKVVGTDPKSDIAVLKIDAKDHSYPALTVADSDKLEVGDVVLAVGNPFGIGQTVTMGIVSATGRATLGLEYEDFIQTDAAINMGNSGGALVDAEGRLVGINTAILSRTGGNQGIGFAVPANLARYVMESIIENGRVIRGFMGVNIQDVTPTLAEKFGVKEHDGAIVSEVTPNSPAAKAGLKDGDVIVEFDGKPVRDSRHLKLQVAETAPGKDVPVKVDRDGSEKELTVTLKEFPQDKDLAKNNAADHSSGDPTDGITVDELNSAARQQFNIPNNVKGALVSEVDPDSAGAAAGIQAGDVILEINRKPVKSSEDAVKMTENLKDDSVLLRVWSHGGSRYVVLKKVDAKVG